MRNDMVQCTRCGETVKRKREAQVYCSRLCSDAAKKQRKRQRRTQRSGDAGVIPIPVPRSGGSPATGLPTGSEMPSGEQTEYKPQKHWEGGPLEGDDYPLEYYPDGYPKLPSCLDRRKARVERWAA